MNICILGQGNAGLMSAIILKKYRPGVNIYCLGSTEKGIVGVGESSTEHFDMLRRLMGVTHKEIVQQTYASLKYGVWFEKWKNDEDYIHALVQNGTTELDEIFGMYGYMWKDMGAMSTIPSNYTAGYVQDDDNLPNQFHFDTFKLNEFLRNQCDKLGIPLVEADIVDVNFDEFGNVDCLVSSDSIGYDADLFVDASGFQRFIISKMDSKFKSKQSDLFVDSAFAFQCPHEGDNYRCFTTAKKMKAGWMWRIPTYTRMGNGYAYNSKYTTYEEAVQEVTDVLGFEPKVGRRFEFEAGYYEKTWINNVVAIGLSSHFFEPLEATAIGVNILQARLLTEFVGSTSDISRRAYNDKIQTMFKQAFMFIRLHYVNCDDDTEFWKMVKESTIPEEVQILLDIAQERMLTSADVLANSDWNIFHHNSYNQVLYALGLLDPKVAGEHLKRMRKDVDFEVKVDSWKKSEQKVIDTGYKHKDLIEKWINEDSTDN